MVWFYHLVSVSLIDFILGCGSSEYSSCGEAACCWDIECSVQDMDLDGEC